MAEEGEEVRIVNLTPEKLEDWITVCTSGRKGFEKAKDEKKKWLVSKMKLGLRT